MVWKQQGFVGPERQLFISKARWSRRPLGHEDAKAAFHIPLSHLTPMICTMTASYRPQFQPQEKILPLESLVLALYWGTERESLHRCPLFLLHQRLTWVLVYPQPMVGNQNGQTQPPTTWSPPLAAVGWVRARSQR